MCTNFLNNAIFLYLPKKKNYSNDCRYCYFLFLFMLTLIYYPNYECVCASETCPLPFNLCTIYFRTCNNSFVMKQFISKSNFSQILSLSDIVDSCITWTRLLFDNVHQTVAVGKYWIVRALEHFLPAELINLRH